MNHKFSMLSHQYKITIQMMNQVGDESEGGTSDSETDRRKCSPSSGCSGVVISSPLRGENKLSKLLLLDDLVMLCDGVVIVNDIAGGDFLLAAGFVYTSLI